MVLVNIQGLNLDLKDLRDKEMEDLATFLLRRNVIYFIIKQQIQLITFLFNFDLYPCYAAD